MRTRTQLEQFWRLTTNLTKRRSNSTEADDDPRSSAGFSCVGIVLLSDARRLNIFLLCLVVDIIHTGQVSSLTSRACRHAVDGLGRLASK